MKQPLAVLATSALALSLVSGCASADVGYGYNYDAGADYAMSRHPNIEQASFHAQQAIDRMQAAQRANHYDMNGHAAHAIALLREAQSEMEASALTITR